jgi:hypothetical protein
MSDSFVRHRPPLRHSETTSFPVWQASWEALQKALFDALVSLKPAMAILGTRNRVTYPESLASSPGQSSNDAIELDSEDEGDDGDISMSGTPKPETPTKKRKVEGTPVPSPLKPQTTSKIPTPDFSEHKTRFQLEALADVTTRTRTTPQPSHFWRPTASWPLLLLHTVFF